MNNICNTINPNCLVYPVCSKRCPEFDDLASKYWINILNQEDHRDKRFRYISLMKLINKNKCPICGNDHWFLEVQALDIDKMDSTEFLNHNNKKALIDQFNFNRSIRQIPNDVFKPIRYMVYMALTCSFCNYMYNLQVVASRTSKSLYNFGANNVKKELQVDYNLLHVNPHETFHENSKLGVIHCNTSLGISYIKYLLKLCIDQYNWSYHYLILKPVFDKQHK